MRGRAALATVVGAGVLCGAAAASAPPRSSVVFSRVPLGPKSAFLTITRRQSIVLAARARRVATIQWNGNRPLLVAPTVGGGFCESLAGAYGGTRCTPAQHRSRGSLTPGLVSDASGPIALDGNIFGKTATRLEIRYRDGSRTTVPFIWVGQPISAGVFVFPIPTAHRKHGHEPIALTVFSAIGRQLATVKLGQQ